MSKMAEEIISKKIAKELMAIKGETRGLGFKMHGDFVEKKRGKKSLQKLEKAMAELGYPIKYNSVESMNFYPVGTGAVSLLVMKKLFKMEDKEFEEMGMFESKTSLIMRLFTKYFVSIEMMVKQTPVIWEKYYTIGNLKVVKLDKEKKYIILRLQGFALHPVHCIHLKGYFSNIVQMVVNASAKCEEIKCPFRGDKYHEFLIKWQ